MKVGAAVAGLAGGAHALFGYNRGNFMYDRKMKLEQEFQIMEFRNKKAALWRDDVRDIVGLTEARMDSYLIVNALLLGMCVGLFAEGRLEPGTPFWLMHLYMMTLGSAFMYLLMSVWFALHAVVLAQCSSVRLLTQLVRLPVPTWRQLESARTYGSEFEAIGKKMLRVPFTGLGAKDPASREAAQEARHATVVKTGASGSNDANSASSAADGASTCHQSAGGGIAGVEASDSAVDPWDLEQNCTNIYELNRGPNALSHHVGLARQSSRYYQCYDAFARVSLSFGTNQLLYAISYFAIGYCTMEDGAPWAAFCVAVIMSGISMSLVELDFKCSNRDRILSRVFTVVGPLCASLGGGLWQVRAHGSRQIINFMVPLAYAAHGGWLFHVLRMLRTERQPNGIMVPVKFRPVVYLDIFGWLLHSGGPVERTSGGDGGDDGGESESTYHPLSKGHGNEYWAVPNIQQAEHGAPIGDDAVEHFASRTMSNTLDEGEHLSTCAGITERRRLRESIRTDVSTWESAKDELDENSRARVERMAELFESTNSCEASGAACRAGLGSSMVTNSRDVSTTLEMESDAAGISRSDSEAPFESTHEFEVAKVEPSRTPEPHLPQWKKLRGYTDLGTEYAYLYDPNSGEVREADSTSASSSPVSSWRASVPPPAPVHLCRSLTFTEANVNHLIELYATSAKADGAASTVAAGAALVAPALALGAPPASSTTTTLREQTLTSKDFAMVEASVDTTEVSEQNADRRVDVCGKHGASLEVAKQAFAWLLEEAEPIFNSADEKGSGGPSAEGELSPGRRAATSLGFRHPSNLCKVPTCNPTANGKHKASIKAEQTSARDETRSSFFADGPGPPEEVQHMHDFYATFPKIPEGEDLMPGHDRLQPGRIPWTLFRMATSLLIFMWFLGVALPLGLWGGEADTSVGSEGPGVEDFAGGQTPLTQDEVEEEELERMHMSRSRASIGILEGARRLDVTWPTHSGFAPRGFSSSPRGDKLFVSDDFGVYLSYGNNMDTEMQEPFSPFKRLLPCPSLEGQELNDIGVVCSGETSQNCHIIVLHSQGKKITDCQLQHERSYDPPESAMPKEFKTWRVKDSWLLPHEYIDGLAVDSSCFIGTGETNTPTTAFIPTTVGCVTVGTSKGRIVQLREHMMDSKVLVPERSIQQRYTSVNQGTLTVFDGRLVLSLRTNVGTFQALNKLTGAIIGDWELPRKHMTWRHICGGGKLVFALGRPSDRTDLPWSIWSFKAPKEVLGFHSEDLSEQTAT
eukprot:TRINITY_DN32429_c0_g1_i1.p1 TRINITY_DN32429_c0_g1~~TRINITY_DN32429_c0_g1_i1.p1  ORF type:complete len:1262 (+),score=162.40 TRINITY_DN32429_c0_g1_i1:230-4015(+)